jgi:FtsP/CotA-like multicopper oxidase with cupredoxin domain
MRLNRRKVLLGAFLLTPLVAGIQNVSAQPLPGGTLDPLTIPKYVTPLVIPPVMDDSGKANDYKIAVRQFKQQILPGGIWDTLTGQSNGFPATTVWSYGPASDPLPDGSIVTNNPADVGVAPAPNSQFNFPAYTMENVKDTPITVDWMNELTTNAWALDRRNKGDALPHLFAVDQSLHWANPAADCKSGEVRTNCAGVSAAPYTGPVPIVTHVHGAHVGGSSDGYTEAWWLPDAKDINCVKRNRDGTLSKTPRGQVTDRKGRTVWEVACEGGLANQLTDETGKIDRNTRRGVGSYHYLNDQPSTTIWYHDHSLGMTRLNVMAGPAGFWLIRDDASGSGETGLTGILPGPAPVRGEDLIETNVAGRHKYREIPIVIQGRSFNADGSLFYPDNRAFFEGLNVAGTDALTNPSSTGPGQFPQGTGELLIDMDPATSDIAPIWNPEAFFNTMVVNGVTWPKLEVAPAQYRFRLLNGTNSRFLNLALKITDAAGNPVPASKTFYRTKANGDVVSRVIDINELEFYQIGAEQSLKPTVTAIRTGRATDLSTATFNNWGRIVRPTKQSTNQQALLMGIAERADVIVDFRGLPDGTIITMTNTAPDEPFGGFPTAPADPDTTGQVMRFVVNSAHLGLSPTDELRDLSNKPLNPAPAAWDVRDLVVDPAALENFSVALTAPTTRELALLEEESTLICAKTDALGNVVQLPDFAPTSGGQCANAAGTVHRRALPFAPKAAVLGTLDASNTPTVTLWSDPITTNVNADGSGTQTAEQWNLHNLTVDGHPIHIHLVKFKVLGRYAEGSQPGSGTSTVSRRRTDPAGIAGIEPWEDGWKDTVITYPGEVTSVAADFDINGLYVWHCHIVEHEDNEMMVPLCVGVAGVDCPAQLFPLQQPPI